MKTLQNVRFPHRVKLDFQPAQQPHTVLWSTSAPKPSPSSKKSHETQAAFSLANTATTLFQLQILIEEDTKHLSNSTACLKIHIQSQNFLSY